MLVSAVLAYVTVASTAVFYNAYVSKESDVGRVCGVAAEQWAQLDPHEHTPRTVVSIYRGTTAAAAACQQNSFFEKWGGGQHTYVAVAAL